MKMPITIATFCFMILSGCAVLESKTAAKPLIQYATLKVIYRVEEDRVGRAQRIIEIAEEGRTYFDQRQLPVSQIEQLIKSKIDWDGLDIPDVVLVNAIINQIVLEIEESVAVDADQYVTGSEVLGWVIEAANMSGV